MEKPLYLGHRKRLKNRYLTSGLGSFEDYEVLELILFFAVPKKDTKVTAKNLIKHFGSISKVLEAPVKELTSVKGIGEHTATLISLFKDMSAYYLKNKIKAQNYLASSDTAKQYLLAKLKPLDKEVFVVLFLSLENEILSDTVLSEGTLDEAAVYPREVLKQALNAKSSRVIFAHNHIGRQSKPSKQDEELTRILLFALNVAGISVLDHLVVSNEEVFSFAENGIISDLQEEYNRSILNKTF